MKRVFFSLLLLNSSLVWAVEKKVVFAGGCFWCMEPPFEKIKGVKSVISGYMGGEKRDATYKMVSSGQTNHIEVIEVSYDNNIVKLKELIEVFWKNIDPTQSDGQFVDKGNQYISAIFYQTLEEQKIAKKSKINLEKSKKFSKTIVTKILKYKVFYPAEEYHQDYYKKNTLRYKFYRYNSGRDQFLKKYWK